MSAASDRLARLLDAGGVVALTGAGISTGSGIPDYRGDPGVVRRPPITYGDFVADPSARRRYWARSHFGWRKVAEAAPNRGHQALAALERTGRVSSVITQNVDGLHLAAGSSRVLELHGALARTVCLRCDERRLRLELHHRLEAANPRLMERDVVHAPDGDAELSDEVSERFVVVDCLSCGGLLKPDVVFFGENVPRPRVGQAFRQMAEASALLVLGSSLAVMSGYRFVLDASKRGLPVAIVNRGPTRGDSQAAIRVEGELSEVLGEVAEAIGTMAGGRLRGGLKVGG